MDLKVHRAHHQQVILTLSAQSQWSDERSDLLTDIISNFRSGDDRFRNSSAKAAFSACNSTYAQQSQLQLL
jgi:hypothetical protein